ncbi:MAG: protein kinase [Candidatus Eiseniibacteriota bacterium]|nr:MAG: protein kinase [Candidatus Eisenbacteria bacterium]
MIGKTISHYKILQKLGEGGMGVVYKAQDTRLGRTIALKFLSRELTREPAAKDRFIQEARAASALDHPNICTIHEVGETEDGQTFISMACYEGVVLKKKIELGGMDLDEVVRIAIQLAEGLAKAHGLSIVHRDIKPANVVITNDGVVKILDFGLAKLSGTTRLAERGSVSGTVAYMSPEQARGASVDCRTDIWSLGVLIYEMLTGRLPFRSEYEQAVVYSILNEEPVPASSIRGEIPRELERVVEKAMAKDLDKRYASVEGILYELRRIREKLRHPESEEDIDSKWSTPSIAVLPFRDMSPQGDQDYFCEGMAEELINALAHIEGLRVVSRTSAFQFKGKNMDVREIGEQLGIRTVLEGSVRKAGNRVRVTAQLVNVADGYHVWSEKYDREMEDIFYIQEEISLAIVNNLKVRLVGEEKHKLLKRHTNNLDAYNLYLEGRWFWNRRTEKDLRKAIECFNHAIAEDPLYALAYSGMADSWNALPSFGSFSPKEVYPRAREAALKALEIDDTLAEAHASLGQIKAEYEWDWAGAEAALKRATELNAAYASAHQWHANVLTFLGRFEEALEAAKRAVELDPLSLIINLNLGQTLYFSGQHDAAAQVLRRLIEMDPAFPYAHFTLGMVYFGRSMNDQALAEFQKEEEVLTGPKPIVKEWIGMLHARMCRTDKTKEVLSELLEEAKRVYVPASCVAHLYAELGETEQSFRWLEKAYEERDMWLRYLRITPYPEPIRSDPRFEAFLIKMRSER